MSVEIAGADITMREDENRAFSHSAGWMKTELSATVLAG